MTATVLPSRDALGRSGGTLAGMSRAGLTRTWIGRIVPFVGSVDRGWGTGQHRSAEQRGLIGARARSTPSLSCLSPSDRRDLDTSRRDEANMVTAQVEEGIIGGVDTHKDMRLISRA